MERTIRDDNFEAEVLKSDLPVLVDFYADWCGPCKMMSPIIAQLAEEYEGAVKVCKCNTDEAVVTALTYRIQAIPMFMLFKNGEVVYKTVGVTPKEELAAQMDAVK